MLEIKNLNAFYGYTQALFDECIRVDEGEIVTIVGANGAGKSTTLKCIMGLINSKNGSIDFMGESIAHSQTDKIVEKGIILVPEGRHVFPGNTVRENLMLGATPLGRGRRELEQEMETVYEMFPRLRERKDQYGWSLSGGEAQMLAIGRGLMGKPKLLLLDEPSLGLSPLLVSQVFESLVEINRRGVSILLVEQNANMALSISKRGYILENGRVSLNGTSRDLAADDSVRKAYLGA